MEDKQTQQEFFHLHNTTRARGNRTLRAQAPAHLRFKQFIAKEQLRLIRGRHLVVSREFIQANLAELTTKIAQGILEVRTPDGRLVDVKTGQATSSVFGVPAKTTPNFLPDDASRDRPAGEVVPVFQGENERMNDQTPALLQGEVFDVELPEESPTVEAASETSVEEEIAPPVFAQVPLETLGIREEDLTPLKAPEAPAPRESKKGKK